MKISLITATIMSLALQQAQASPPVFEYCIEQNSRYVLKGFVSNNQGDDLGTMKVFDTLKRQQFDLFCGYERDEKQDVEIACVSSHFGSDGSGQTIRVRVHRKKRKEVPRLALIEVQQKGQPIGSINEIIPMACNK